MKYNIFRLTLALMLFLSSRTYTMAQESSAYSFLDLPTSTLRYGLGGVNISSIEDDINSIDQNPGLLGPEIDMQVGINYMRYIGESNFAGIRFGKRAGSHGAWAAGIQYYGYGEIKGADINGILTDNFSPKDMVFSGTYSHDIVNGWRGGVTLKYIYSSYDSYTAMALATDMGINYFDSEADFSFSAVVTNLGGQIKGFENTYERLPIDIRLGVSKSFGTLPVIWSLTAWNLTKWKYSNSNLLNHIVLAADFVPSKKFHIGVGYNHKTRSDMSGYRRGALSGLSACIGVNVRNFAVGVAMAQLHNGATTIMLNLSTNIYEF